MRGLSAVKRVQVIVVTRARGNRQGVRWLRGGLKVYYLPLMPMPDVFSSGRVSLPTLFRSVVSQPREWHRAVEACLYGIVRGRPVLKVLRQLPLTLPARDAPHVSCARVSCAGMAGELAACLEAVRLLWQLAAAGSCSSSAGCCTSSCLNVLLPL